MAVDALEYDEVAKPVWQQFEVEKGELIRASKEEGEVPSSPSSRAQRVLTRVNCLFPSKAGYVGYTFYS